jgi:hypothetical protein
MGRVKTGRDKIVRDECPRGLALARIRQARLAMLQFICAQINGAPIRVEQRSLCPAPEGVAEKSRVVKGLTNQVNPREKAGILNLALPEICDLFV